MSVDALLVRIAPSRLTALRTDDLAREIEELRFGADAPPFRLGVQSGDRLLYLDEWSATLLAPGHLDPPHPLASALRPAQALEGVKHGAGIVGVIVPEEAERLADALAALPRGAMFEPSEWGRREPSLWVTDGAHGYPAEEAGVRRRADELLELLQAFYARAASADDAVVTAVV